MRNKINLMRPFEQALRAKFLKSSGKAGKEKEQDTISEPQKDFCPIEVGLITVESRTFPIIGEVGSPSEIELSAVQNDVIKVKPNTRKKKKEK